jgi:phosphoenolpyruvate-protein kinase (PTS system EI component)
MIETPAAVMHLRSILDQSDFVSIGTNDLTQYVMAAGRENSNVAEYYKQGTSTIIDIIKDMCAIVLTTDKECCVCGEIAGSNDWIVPLLKAGVRHLSMSPYRIPVMKDKIRSSTLG